MTRSQVCPNIALYPPGLGFKVEGSGLLSSVKGSLYWRQKRDLLTLSRTSPAPHGIPREGLQLVAPLHLLPARAADAASSAAADGFVDGRLPEGGLVDVAATLAAAVAAAEQELQAVREDMVAALGAVSWLGACLVQHLGTGAGVVG